jgi:aspartate aminotransferase
MGSNGRAEGHSEILVAKDNVERYLKHFKQEIDERLTRIFKGIKELKESGFAVDAVAPQAAIYLTIKMSLVGKTTHDGEILESQSDVTDYLLSEAKLAIVPFYAFGAEKVRHGIG